MIREAPRKTRSGLLTLAVLILAFVGAVALFVVAVNVNSGIVGIVAIVSAVVIFVLFFGLFTVNPNEARVLQLFGNYVGSERASGLRFANPFFSKRRISLRTRNFETGKLKVNDLNGNPIEIGAVVVWKVVDTAEALFNVDDYRNYVHVQSESAVRNLATGYAYDAHEEGEVSLSSHTTRISGELRDEVQKRLDEAGVEVLEARISHLAYAPEIAAAMLQRQQASAVVAARQKIVEGAVGMVEHALEMLSEKQVVTLDEERKAAMVSNLLVVLCSDRHTQPVVNTGTLHN